MSVFVSSFRFKLICDLAHFALALFDLECYALYDVPGRGAGFVSQTRRLPGCHRGFSERCRRRQ